MPSFSDRVARRNPDALYHKMTVSQLGSLCPFIDWNAYIEGIGSPKIESLNVNVPDFFSALDKTLAGASMDTLKAYLKWQIVRKWADQLSTPFVSEHFAFYDRTLTGAKELRPRWKRCVEMVDRGLGEALGQKFVEETFSPDAKRDALAMVKAIEAEMNKDLHDIDWMTPETKRQAFAKLDAIANKIGYPDKWRDYSSVRVVRGDLFADALQATTFEVQRQLRKIGNPVDRMEFHITPPTVDAYYSPAENNINFPAGVFAVAVLQQQPR